MKTRLELVNICKRKTKDTSTLSATNFADDLIIAEGIVDSILNRGKIRTKTATLSLVDGTETYALASDVGTVKQMLLTSPANDEKEIQLIDTETFRRMNPATSNDSKGIPDYYYFIEPTVGATNIESKNINFYPIPDDSYTATYTYRRNSDFMAADTDYPSFDERYHHILADYAIWQYYERETDESGNPMYWQNKWNQDLDWLIETYPRDGMLLPIPGPDQYEVD